MGAIFERELKAYFTGLTGYLFCAFVLLFSGVYTMVLCLRGGYPNFEYVLGSMALIYLLAIPLLTMRVISEERKNKTDQLLYSLPLSLAQVVLGKYFAMLAVLAVPTLITAVYPLILSGYGVVSLTAAYGALLGFYLLGAALVAIGMFISSLTENQVIAAVVCLAVLLVNYFQDSLAVHVSSKALTSFLAIVVVLALLALVVQLMTKNYVVSGGFFLLFGLAALAVLLLWPAALEGLFAAALQQLSLFNRFYAFVDGVFDLTAIFFYLSISAVFVFFTVQSMEKRRWS